MRKSLDVSLYSLYHHNGVTRTLGHSREVWSVAFSPDGSKLAAADEEGRVKLWDPLKGDELAVISGHQQGIWGVAWSHDGRKLATASTDTTAKLWDTATGQVLFTLRGHTKRVSAAAFSSDGKRLATGSDDGTVKMWDTTSGSELMTILAGAVWIRSLAVSPDGRMLATGHSGYGGAATALVHEAYIKLFGDGVCPWRDRAHFFNVAARQMRHLLEGPFNTKHLHSSKNEQQKTKYLDEMTLYLMCAYVVYQGVLPWVRSGKLYSICLCFKA